MDVARGKEVSGERTRGREGVEGGCDLGEGVIAWFTSVLESRRPTSTWARSRAPVGPEAVGRSAETCGKGTEPPKESESRSQREKHRERQRRLDRPPEWRDRLGLEVLVYEVPWDPQGGRGRSRSKGGGMGRRARSPGGSGQRLFGGSDKRGEGRQQITVGLWTSS